LKFEDIHFDYESESGDKSFALGPVNLEIEKGETIFIIGGNGSGKSTFINVFCGLYTPSKGQVIINGDSSIDAKAAIHSLTSAIFTDNHIFSQNYNDFVLENNPEYHELLKAMKLDDVLVDDKAEPGKRGYSKGQSKRMSMIFALLQHKPVLVLDEWAADQDPQFRKYFYEVLLPKLKSEGKTIIAVTHDDAYFKHADRVIKFDYGKIVKDVKVAEELLYTKSLW